MRAQSDSWFATYLLRIGNGTEETNADDYVILPDDILIKSPSEEICIDMLIDCVFLDLEKNYRSASYMRERAILSTRNEHVDVVNANMIDKFPGDKHVYYSFDEVEDDPQNNYPLSTL
jgi:ATP-dependent DNA helicase PIF1